MSLTLTCLVCGQGNRLPKEKPSRAAKCGACGAMLMADQPLDITLAILQKAVRLDQVPLVVDFWAAWCGPCRMMAPEFAKAAIAMQGGARFAKLDTESYPDAGARYAIRGIPLMIAFRNGVEVKRQAGAMSTHEICEWVAAVARA